ncbi:MAG TPA: helix-hairpin-helix domain-containing protein, partial [Solirubrobacterales bacterium]
EMSLFGLKLGGKKKREAAQAEQRLAEARIANERALAEAQTGGQVPPSGQLPPWEEATTVQPPTGELAAVPSVSPPPIPGSTPAPGEYDPAAAQQRVRDKVAEVQAEQQRIGAEADRRLQAAEQLQQHGGVPAGGQQPPVGGQPIQDVQPQAPQAVPAPAADLRTVEQRIEEERAARDRQMKEAEERLRQVEERTKAAEERAAEAKRLEEKRAEEAVKDQRLEEMRRSVAEAEERAREAERRAEEAEQAALQSVQGGGATPPPPAPEPQQSFAPPTPPPEPYAPPTPPPTPAPESQSYAPPTPPPVNQPPQAEPFPATPAPPAESFNQPTPPPEPSTPPPPPAASQPPTYSVPDPAARPIEPVGGGSGEQINLNTVTFEQLREQNLSVTQATRLLAHRERLGGFQSVDDVDQVAGFPQEMLDDLKSRSTT